MTKDFIGFRRVIINANGEAVTPGKAAEMGIKPDVGFMRADGWSLGAPKHLEKIAFDMWADEWTHVIKKPANQWSIIDDYYYGGGDR